MKLENVGKKYGATVALEGLGFEIAQGSVTAVLGESGAGKTTLLNILAGLLSYEGLIDGAEGIRPVRRARCSYLFQDANLLPNLTAEGNLRLVLPREQWGEIGGMLAEVGLAGKEKSKPRELSGGERQRVAIARAFLYPHDLLLLDEPFASLDLRLKKSLIELVRSLKTERETVVFVTHDVHEAAMLADRALVLDKGRLTADIPIEWERDFFEAAPAEAELVRALMGDAREKRG